MSTAPDAPQRLIEVERIVAQLKLATAAGGDTDGYAALQMAHAPIERIRQCTSILQRHPDDGLDDVDVVVRRLILNDYVVAIQHFRTVVRAAITYTDTASATIKDGKRLVRREQKLAAKRTVRRAEMFTPR